MLREQLALLSPFVAILVVAAVFVLYVHYTSPRHYRIKLLLGPVLLGACVFAVPSVGARLGYGWPVALPDAFQYIGHRNVVVGGEKRWIDVLLVSRKPLGQDARLHRVPWTRDMEHVMEQAEQLKDGPAGGEIVVSRSAAGRDGRTGPGGYSAARILPQQQIPKQPPPAPGVAPGGNPRRQPVPPFELLV